ncbi:type VI secretion system baseplate subunit TssF [Azospirillum agricola]|uniref:type VI secretion system baseplate subunit TssF n=1 Tax=Azospirillum agricola TaxID=1720247 RepID=UPI000A0F1E0E|nr:type VI secretion system baseplate subunit TssF [Azospirillum agricola]SMH63013.1 type VI secretion system protein ImpG [Azospirillum lipoferum]
MAGEDRNDLLDYYQRELSYLRHEGAAFAARYPRVAARLDLSGAESPDPHVERLLESVAFLTARIQRTLDSDFPMIPAALLGVLYPHLVAPVPSLAIAQFTVDPDQARAATGFTLPDETPLFAEALDGLTCRFRTAYPVELWPVEVADAAIQTPAAFSFLDRRTDIGAVLRVTLRGLGRLTFADMAPKRLRLHLHGGAAGSLHELLLNEVRGIAVRPVETAGAVRELPGAQVRPVGFAPDEDVLPWPRHAHQGYRLIQEYFVFPEKYLFVDIEGLEGLGDAKETELLFLLSNPPRRAVPLDRESFRLNCAPIVNLFRRTTEPVRLDQTQVDYRLPPDSHRERSTEIHSILKVSASSAYEDDSRVFQPFFSFDHSTGRENGRDGPRAFWTARRQPTGRADLPGTDLVLSFLDLDFKPTRPPAHVVFAHTLCTNRGVAEQMPAGARLEIEVDAPLSGIACLTKPTRQRTPPLAGQTLWRLVSHLSLNHLSLDGEGGLAALREILRLYAAFDDASVAGQIAGLSGLSCRPVVRRVGNEAWRGFCRGTEVTLELDEERFVGSHPFLLASVLNRFLGLYAAVNSFTQLVLTSRQRNGHWKTWPPLAGDRPVL